MFKNGKGTPADFDDAVAELGGVVDGVLGQISVAVVSGLTDEAAEQLAVRKDIDMVGPDFEVTLDDPAEMETAAAGAIVASSSNPATAFFYLITADDIAGPGGNESSLGLGTCAERSNF